MLHSTLDDLEAALESWRSALPESLSNSLIPHIIHQVWMNECREIPAHWVDSPRAWQALHPSAHYILWNRRLGYQLVQRHYSQYLLTYLEFKHEIQRIDFLRYCFLDRYGGIYSDLDLVPQQAFDSLLQSSDVSVVASQHIPGVYTNSLMISPAKSPLWADLQNECLKPIPWWILGKHLTVMYVVGPLALTRAIERSQIPVRRLPHSLFNPPFNQPTVWIASTHGHSWHSWDTRCFNWALAYWRWILLIVVCLLARLIWLRWRCRC